ncbi:TVP38/TMEM64 family membrane protein slr0305-like [Hibiscus syriacus]|uniref:TVP38/TMEM64 family membrane protein slr0305-like n=1 Tax=Hibiscus syriacus TaxID=106335 RepID=UPI0019203C5B|nr:TVP38/TMEM64 family membrane protein slr0305-like [Hibiscus syriacus]
MADVFLTLVSASRIVFSLLFLVVIASVLLSIPIEKSVKGFLFWVKEDLGQWGPFVLAISYIPFAILAVPASVLTLGGGYLFGLPVGFLADSIGAAVEATAAFILGRTVLYSISKLRNYPKFQAVARAIETSGFKIVFLRRLVSLVPFSLLNYFLFMTPVHLRVYMLASWLGMMPSIFALAYVGTTVKDLSDVTHEWNDTSTIRQASILPCLSIALIWLTKVAMATLEKALAATNAKMERAFVPSMLAMVPDSHYPIDVPLNYDRLVGENNLG